MHIARYHDIGVTRITLGPRGQPLPPGEGGFLGQSPKPPEGGGGLIHPSVSTFMGTPHFPMSGIQGSYFA